MLTPMINILVHRVTKHVYRFDMKCNYYLWNRNYATIDDQKQTQRCPKPIMNPLVEESLVGRQKLTFMLEAQEITVSRCRSRKR